jgi:hypothetical protein
MNEAVTLTIRKNETLALFELLWEFHDQPSLAIRDNAQRLALIRVVGALDKTLVEPFSPDYREILEEATRQLLNESSEDPNGDASETVA